MQNEFSGIVGTLEEEMTNSEAEAIQEATYEELQNLKIEAQKYLELMSQVEKQINNFRNLLKKQSAIRSLASPSEKDALEYDRNKRTIRNFLLGSIPKKIYQASFNFLTRINDFIGQTVITTYVHEGQQGPELYQIKNHQVLKFEYSSANQLVARYNLTQNTLNSPKLAQKMTKETNAVPPEKLANLKLTYSTVLRRYRISRKTNRRVVLWKEDGEWSGATVSSEGDIQESYAMFVILNKDTPTFMKILELMVKDYMIEGVLNIKNISGLLQGDITLGNYEYAVKSAGATTLGLRQISTLARQILKEEFSKKKLLEIKRTLEKKGVRRNKLQQDFGNTYDDLISLLESKEVKVID